MSKPLFYGIDLSDIVKTGESSEPVQYVGVYVLDWGKETHPSMGFSPVEDHVLKSAEQIHKALLPFAQAYFDAIDNGEIWQGAFDRISEDDLIAAMGAAIVEEDEDDN